MITLKVVCLLQEIFNLVISIACLGASELNLRSNEKVAQETKVLR